MAVYKVPQNVEADDKLIGPFSFRQFIYLIVVAIAGFLAYILSQVFIVLAIIPLPVMIFFGAIALPLRKDQPMELYLLALVQFYLKPKKRLWEPEGVVTMVEIMAPKVVEAQRTKDFSGDEASNRLDYLAQIMDTRGWSTRGAKEPEPVVDTTTVAPKPSSTTKYEPFEEVADVLDEQTPIAQKFEREIEEREQEQKEILVGKIKEGSEGIADKKKGRPKTEQASSKKPVKASSHATKKKTAKASVEKASAKTIPPDIINLAHNKDFSVQTIAREAKRINKREGREIEIGREVEILIPH